MSKRFDDGTVALDEADLTAESGRIVVLLGPSGCGKTTLLRCIAGLEDPSSGSVRLGGRDLTALEPAARNVAMVFQNHGLYPNKTAFGNIEFPLRMAKVRRVERERRVCEIARMLRIEDVLHRRPAALSGGQRQRVGIGRALVREPDLVLMDEPLSSLDADLRTAMRGEIRALQRRFGWGMVYVTHDQTEALALADQLVVMRSGSIEQVGSAQEVFNRPQTTFVAAFLGAMNLLEQADTTAVQIPQRLEFRQPWAHLGIRAEDLRLGTADPDSLELCGRVSEIELLGREHLLHVQLDDRASVRVKVGSSAGVGVGDRIRLHAHADDVHLFDEAGQRLTPPERQEQYAAPNERRLEGVR
ncbi:ABC transporter ATP-binding protein [Nocardia sp. NPDC004711]